MLLFTHLAAAAVAVVAVQSQIFSDRDNLTAYTRPLTLVDPIPAYQLPSSYSFSNRTIISLITLICYGEFSPPYFDATTIKAMQVGLDYLRSSHPNWLPDYEIVIEAIDDQCSESMIIGGLASKLRQDEDDGTNLDRLPLVLIDGQDVGQHGSAYLSRAYNYSTMLIEYATPEMNVHSERYKWLLGFAEPFSSIVAFTGYFKQLGWSKVAFLSEICPICNVYDKPVVQALERENITLTYMAKFQADSPEDALEEMKFHNPRIIIVGGTFMAHIACWLWKYGMTGPYYVFFGSSLAYYGTDVPLPPKMATWCTKEIMQETLQNFFTFGYSTVVETVDNYTDSNGRKYQEVFDAVIARSGQYLAPTYTQLSIPYNYDRILIAGLLLNETNTLLKANRNESLRDWKVGTRRWKEHPDVFAQTLREASSRIWAKGYMGEYQLDGKDPSKLKGWQPVSFQQISFVLGPDNKTKTMQHRTVAYYKSNLNSIIQVSPEIWRTVDGKPPKDSLTLVSIEQPPIAFPTYVILLLLAVLMSLVCLGLLVLSWYRQKSRKLARLIPEISGHDRLLILGVLILVNHIFALPSQNSQIRDCYIMSVLVIVGFSLASIVQWTKLSYLLSKLDRLNWAGRNDAQKWEDQPIAQRELILCGVWIFINTVIVIEMLDASPFVKQRRTLSMSIYEFKGIAIETYRYECQFTKPLVNYSFLAATGTLQVLVLLHSVVQTYVMRFRYWFWRKTPFFIVGRRLALAIYCQVLTIFACCLIAAIKQDDSEVLYIIVACTSLCYALVNVTFVFFKSKKAKIRSRQSAAQ